MSETGIRDIRTLRRFLSTWLEQSIARSDFPIIRWAYESASRNDANALIALDQLASTAPLPPPMRAASIRTGQQRLQTFASLKGHTCVRKYQSAVAAGQAQGHNAVVQGIHLFLFSIPIREGLLSYGYQLLSAFVDAAATSLQLESRQIRPFVEELASSLPRHVETSLTVKREQSPSEIEDKTKAVGSDTSQP